MVSIHFFTYSGFFLFSKRLAHIVGVQGSLLSLNSDVLSSLSSLRSGVPGSDRFTCVMVHCSLRSCVPAVAFKPDK